MRVHMGVEIAAPPEVVWPYLIEPDKAMARQMAKELPNIVAVMEQITHDEASVVGSGCDDQFEFVFALDLLLDGLDRLNRRDASDPASGS